MVGSFDSFLKNVLCCKIIGTFNLGMIKSHFFSNKFVDLTIFWNINRRMILGTSWGNLLENVQKNILHNVLRLRTLETLKSQKKVVTL